MNEPEALKVTEIPTPAANKASCLADQNSAIEAASAGSSIFRSAAAYLADNPEVKGYQK